MKSKRLSLTLLVNLCWSCWARDAWRSICCWPWVVAAAMSCLWRVNQGVNILLQLMPSVLLRMKERERERERLTWANWFIGREVVMERGLAVIELMGEEEDSGEEEDNRRDVALTSSLEVIGEHDDALFLPDDDWLSLSCSSDDKTFWWQSMVLLLSASSSCLLTPLISLRSICFTFQSLFSLSSWRRMYSISVYMQSEKMDRSDTMQVLVFLNCLITAVSVDCRLSAEKTVLSRLKILLDSWKDFEGYSKRRENLCFAMEMHVKNGPWKWYCIC